MQWSHGFSMVLSTIDDTRRSLECFVEMTGYQILDSLSSLPRLLTAQIDTSPSL